MIDAATGTITGTIPLVLTAPAGLNPVPRLVVTPNGHNLYAYTAGGIAYSVIDLVDNRVRGTLVVSNPIDAIAFAQRGRIGYLAMAGSGYTINADTGGELKPTNGLSDDPHSVALSDDDLTAIVTDRQSSAVTDVDLTTGAAVATIGVGAEPVDVSIDGSGRAYIANSLSDTVSVVAVRQRAVVATVPSEFAAPTALAVSPDGRTLYVGGLGSDLRIVDTATEQATGVITGVGAQPDAIEFSPDGRRAYVSGNGTTLAVVDTAARKVIATVPLGEVPVGVAVSPDSSRAYVAVVGIGLLVLDTGTNTVIGTISVPDILAPAPVLSPDGATLYLYGNLGLQAVDTATGTVSDPIGTGFPVGISPNGATVYTLRRRHQIQAIDTTTHAAVVINVPAPATTAALSPDGTRLYVLAGPSVTTIDTATNTVTGTTNLGDGQWADLAVG
jgi:YVTN family beta-propeller protein